MRQKQVVGSMTGASPVTTLLVATAWLATPRSCIVVTGLAPVMPPAAFARFIKAQQFLG